MMMKSIVYLVTTLLISYCLAAPVDIVKESVPSTSSNNNAELDKLANLLVPDESYQQCDGTNCPPVDGILKAMHSLSNPAATDELAIVYETLKRSSGKVSDMELPPEKALFIYSVDENVAHQISHLEAYGSTLRPSDSNPIRLGVSQKMHLHKQKLEQFRLLRELFDGKTTAKQALYEKFKIFHKENPDSQTKIEKVVQFMTDHKLYMDLHNIEASLSMDEDESKENPSTSYTLSDLTLVETESFLAEDIKLSQADDSGERALRFWFDCSLDSLATHTRSITEILQIVETEKIELPEFARLFKETLASSMETLENIMEYHISTIQALEKFDASYIRAVNPYNPALIALSKIGNVLEQLATLEYSKDFGKAWMSLLIKYTIQNRYLQFRHQYLELQFLTFSIKNHLHVLKNGYNQLSNEAPISVDTFMDFMEKHQRNAKLIKQYIHLLKLRSFGESAFHNLSQNVGAYSWGYTDKTAEDLANNNEMYLEIMELGEETPQTWIQDDVIKTMLWRASVNINQQPLVHRRADDTVTSIRFPETVVPDIKEFLMEHKKYWQVLKSDSEYVKRESGSEPDVEAKIDSMFSPDGFGFISSYTKLQFADFDYASASSDMANLFSIKQE